MLFGAICCAHPGALRAAVAPRKPAVPIVSASDLRDALAKDGHVAIYGIAFAINKADLRLAEAEPILRQILALLLENPALRLEIQVHSDDSFRNVYGRRPTQDRAQTIMRWLIAQGIAPARLIAKGYGETQPLASNHSAAGRARNRRVELVKLPD